MVTYPYKTTSTSKQTQFRSCARHVSGYRIMRRIFLIFLTVTFAVGAKAQYPYGMSTGLGWGTEAGSIGWYYQQMQALNAQRMNSLLMSQQIQNECYRQSQIQQQQLQQWQQYQYNPLPTFPGTGCDNYNVPVKPEVDSEQEAAPRMRRREVQCSNCSGSGFIPKTMYMGNNQIRTIQRRCTFCHGTGRVKETYCE